MSTSLATLVVGGLALTMGGAPAQEPEPLRTFVVSASRVAPNLAEQIAWELSNRLSSSAEFEVVDWEAAFDGAMRERGTGEESWPDPSCIVALQLAVPLDVDVVACVVLDRGRDGLEITGTIQRARREQHTIPVRAFEGSTAAAHHIWAYAVDALGLGSGEATALNPPHAPAPPPR